MMTTQGLACLCYGRQALERERKEGMMSFKQWIQRVDGIVRTLIGRSIYDMARHVPFCDLCQWHADEVTAKDAAYRIINDNEEADNG